MTSCVPEGRGREGGGDGPTYPITIPIHSSHNEIEMKCEQEMV